MLLSKSLVLVLSIFLFFAACNKTEPTFPPPSIEFDSSAGFVSSDTTLLLGAKVKIRIHANTNSNVTLTHLNVTGIRDSVVTSFDTGIYGNSFDYSLSLSKGIALQEEWQFYVRDRLGRKSEIISLHLKKDSASIFGDIRHIGSLLLGAQKNQGNGSFYSFETEQVYTLADAFDIQEKINLLYFYDLIETDANTISSPGANVDASVFGGEAGLANWITRNTVRFEQKDNLTVSDFNKCQNDSLILTNTFVFSSGYRKAKNLTPGVIYAFVTDTDLKGLFVVMQVQGTDEGEIELEIKMEN